MACDGIDMAAWHTPEPSLAKPPNCPRNGDHLSIDPCIPSSRSRQRPYPYDKTLYRQRHKVENLFAKLKDWRRIATRYDRCAHTFFSAICIAATVIFWL